MCKSEAYLSCLSFQQISCWGQAFSDAAILHKARSIKYSSTCDLLVRWLLPLSHTHERPPQVLSWASCCLLPVVILPPRPPLGRLITSLLQNIENKWTSDPWRLQHAASRTRAALRNAPLNVFSSQKFWNTHWFREVFQLFFIRHFIFFKTERMTWRQDVKMMRDCVTFGSNEQGKFISDSITCSPGEHEPSVAKLWHEASTTCTRPPCPSAEHQLMRLKAGGTSDGWLQSVVGYFRIHLLCVI